MEDPSSPARMNLKTFIGILVTSALAFYLMIFTGSENFNAAGEASAPTKVETGLKGAGFLLSLPSLPFSYLIERAFNPHWAAVWTWFWGSLLSASFWSFTVQQLITRVNRAKI